MSISNDEIFSKFMVNLSRKMIEREDTRAAHHKQIVDQMNALRGASGHSAWAGASVLFANMPLTRENVTDDEMAVIRAYHCGENVLTTILSQER
jgi:hypothetical protein